MDLSIIVITYNSETTILECLSAIFKNIKRSNINIEVIVIDANSTDQTINIISEFFPKIKVYFTTAKNRSVSFNLGVKKSNAKYICRVDARSIIPDDYVTKCYSFLIANKNYFNVGGKLIPKNENPLISNLYSNKISFGNASFRISNIDKDVETVYLGFYNKKIYNELGGYDEANHFINEETDLNHRALKNNFKIRYISSLKVTYITRDGIKDYLQTLFRYGAARCGFFIKNKQLPFRLLLFLIYYFLLIIELICSYFNSKFLILSFNQILIIFILFLYDFRFKNTQLNFLEKIYIFLIIIYGHLNWIFGFCIRFFIKRNIFN